jgi:hypothetical protein
MAFGVRKEQTHREVTEVDMTNKASEWLDKLGQGLGGIGLRGDVV